MSIIKSADRRAFIEEEQFVRSFREHLKKYQDRNKTFEQKLDSFAQLTATRFKWKYRKGK